jgi:hypothetical protein
VSGYAHPGSIQAEVGRCLEGIHKNLEQQDMPGVWNFVQQLQTATRVYWNKDDDLTKAMGGLPNPLALKDPGEAFGNFMERQYICFQALHNAKLYGYGTPELGSAEGLVKM